MRFYTAPPHKHSDALLHGQRLTGNVTTKGVFLGPVHAVAEPLGDDHPDAFAIHGRFLAVQVPHPDHPGFLVWVNVTVRELLSTTRGSRTTEFCLAVPRHTLWEWYIAGWCNIFSDEA